MRLLFRCFIFFILIGQAYMYGQEQLSLDGNWDIIFDDKNEGREAKWQTQEIFETHPEKQSIAVPSCWEKSKQDYEGVAFYQRSFEVPKGWKDKVIHLQFDAVNYISEVWINEEVVGFHEGGFTPFEFRVDEMIKVGESNRISLRVVGPIILAEKEIDGINPLETPQWRGGITGGIWQSVRLVATGDVYIEDVFIQPNIKDNTASFQVELDHAAITGTEVAVEINITDVHNPSQKVASIQENWKLHPGKNKHSWMLNIPNAVYWSPDNPHLYRAEIKVHNKATLSDTWTHRFGMRELTITDKDFYLNGKRIYIKASFFEGLYPTGIAYPDNEAMARKEIRLAKEAGFNMIRPWRRPPAPMWLDLADEMGVLVVGSPVLECMTLPFSTPYLPTRVENEVRESILRDRNRACIVQWELFNELHRPVLKQMMRPMAMLARTLDPTRLILDESGGWAFGANMYLPNQYEPSQFNDIHNYPGPFINKERYDGYLSIGMTKQEKENAALSGKTPGRNVVPGLMSYVSELGYGSLPNLVTNNVQFKEKGNPLTPAYRYHERLDMEQREMLMQSGFSHLYPDMQQFYLDQQSIHGTANKRMIEAVRANPEVDGYCIHALVAGDWILGAGLLDLWRNPKSYAYEGTKAANQPRIISIRTKARNIYAEKGTSLEIIGVNELQEIDGNLSIEITSAKGKVVFRKKININWTSGISQLLTASLPTQKWKGSYSIQARLYSKENSILAENTYAIDVFSSRDLAIPKNSIAVLDESNSLTPFLKKSAIQTTSFNASTPISTPVFVTATQLDRKKEDQETLETFMESGGTVVFMEGEEKPLEDSPEAHLFSAKVHPAVGLWTCIPHLVKEHPIFKGLPVNGMMRNVYENVWARKTLRNVELKEGEEMETVVGVIAFDWFSREHKMHYSGPGESWWGSDVAVVSVGKGRYIISQLHLLQNLGKDPVADKILFNLIRYAAK